MGVWDQDVDVADALAAAPPSVTTDYLGNGDSNTVYRLREGIERFLITDINNPGASAKAQSEIPIAWDITATFVSGFNHVPGGSNILYLDGHVKFERYPGKDVTSKAFAGVVGCVLD
jgi:prepilin-type processing-associated H-X9-DG protein